MSQNVSETGEWRQASCKIHWQNTQRAYPDKCGTIIHRLLCAFESNDAMTNINATLCSNLQVSLDNIAQVSIPVKIKSGLLREWLQPG